MPKSNVKVEIPDPVVNGKSVVEYDEEADMVYMPSWFWKKIMRYIIVTSRSEIASEMEEGE